MSRDTPVDADVASRLAKLEADVARWRRWAALSLGWSALLTALLGGGAVALSRGWAPLTVAELRARDLRVRSLTVVTPDDQPRIVADADPEAALQLYTPTGEAAGLYGTLEGRPVMTVGSPLVGSVVMVTAAPDLAGLRVLQAGAGERLSLEINGEDSTLSLQSPSGVQGVQVTANEKIGAMAFLDAAGVESMVGGESGMRILSGFAADNAP